MAETGIQLEFEVGHGLEVDLKWQVWRGFVYLRILGSEMPEIIGEDDRFIEACGPSLVS